MREHFSGILIFAALAAAIPLIALDTSFVPIPVPIKTEEAPITVPINTQESESIPAETPKVLTKSGSFKILNNTTGKIFTVDAKEYIRGALAAEMPPTFHPEAMKAQAVAAHTYALAIQAMNKEVADPMLKGADFSADPDNWKSYTTEENFRERYGELSDSYWKIITDAADSVSDYIMLYNDEPIMAAYCSMNTGMTEDASNVWTGKANYLIPVESRGDMLAPDYEVKQKFSSDVVAQALSKAYPDIILGENPADWFILGERSGSGYILNIKIGDKDIPAKELRKLLELRSTAFTVEYINDEFCFTVHGYGHGVGLSQYGADYYARQGLDFTEILEHYYPGARLGLVKNPT